MLSTESCNCALPARLWLAVLALAGSLTLGTAGEPPAPASEDFSPETFTTEQGLPQRAVVSLTQTRDGYLWAGTYGGLARFDGVRFTAYDSANSPGLQDGSATALLEDDRGTLWIGHESGRLSRLQNGRFSPVPLDERVAHGQIVGLAKDIQGDLWVSSQYGEVTRARDGFCPGLLPGVGPPPNGAPVLTRDPTVGFWVTQDGKAACLSSNRWQSLGDGNAAWAALYVWPERGGGMLVLDTGAIHRWRTGVMTTLVDPLPWGRDSAPSAFLETGDGRLVVGTMNNGLFISRPQGGWLNLSRSNGLPDDWVRALKEDREGNLWVGTSGGLTVLRPRRVAVVNPPDGWQGKPAMPVLIRHNGELWAGTEGAGIYRLKGGEWRHFTASDGLGNAFVWSLFEDRRANLWAGTWRGGIYRFEEDRWVRAPALQDITESVTAFAEEPDGTLWIGTGAGLARHREGRTEWFGREGGPRLPDVRAIAIAPDGTLWAGAARAGLAQWKDGRLRAFGPAEGMPSKFILSLHLEPEGSLWIGTLDQGLIRHRDGRFAVVGVTNGLPNATIFHIADDDRGNFFLASANGIFRAAKRDLHACADGQLEAVNCQHYGRSEGMASSSCSGGFQSSGARSADGRLWIPTARGLAVVDPRDARANRLPPPVFVEGVTLDGDPVPLPAAMPQAAQAFVVPPGGQRVELRYTGLSFTSPERVRFRYQLEGLEKEWVEAGARRSVLYSFLAPGDYTFRVTACNNDGVWNDQPAMLLIRVQPRWWQTWWAQTGSIALGAAGVAAGVWIAARARLRRRLDRIAREQELERERTRIAQDIHDDLGASLTRISMLSEAAFYDPPDPQETTRNLSKIASTARELTRAMDEIVWAVNPRHDSLDSLVNYLLRYAQDFASTAGLRCRLDVPVQLPETHVRAEIRHNLFLAFKEAMNNVVRHARATEIRVSLALPGGDFQLSLRDNGAGFAPGTQAAQEGRLASGNGLENMTQRLAQIGGRCEIQSAPGEGTRALFTVPLNAAE